MDDKILELLQLSINNIKTDVIQPIREDISEIRKDISELKQFKWKVTGMAVFAGAFTGILGFSIAKIFDKLF